MKKTLFTAVAVAITAAATACSPVTSSSSEPDLSKYASTHVQLDPSRGRMVFPLDAFSSDAEGFLTIDKANHLAIEKCVKRAGQPMIPYRSMASDEDERLFGLWVEPFAATYAYGVPKDLNKVGYVGGTEKSTPASVEAYRTCVAQLKDKLLPILRSNEAGSTEPAAVGASKSIAMTQKNALYEATWKSWAECVRKSNISVSGIEDGFAPNLPPDEEGKIRVALIDVRCKRETNVVQTLGDLFARYQAAYIEENEAALMEQKKKLQQTLQKAEEIINNNAAQF